MLTERGPSLHHIAFRTNDLERDRGQLARAGYSELQGADFVGGGGIYSVFDTLGAVGTMLELFEIRPAIRP